MKLSVTTTCEPFLTTGGPAIESLLQGGCEFVKPAKLGALRGGDLIAAIGAAHAVIADLDLYDEAVFQASPQLQLVARWGVGFDAVDLAAATRAGVIVTNTPGVLDETVADLTMALLLGIARDVPRGDATMKQGQWRRAWAADVHHKTLGLVGCGRIGLAVARRASGFNMRVIAHDRQPREEAVRLGVEFKSLNDLLEQADFVSLHAAVTAESRGMIGRDQLQRMKPSAFLINTARGALVDEAALVEALNNGTIAGAALDAFAVEPLPADHPLRTARNTLLTPHMASLTTDNGRRISDLAARAVIDLAAGRAPRHVVNPDVLKSTALRAKLNGNVR